MKDMLIHTITNNISTENTTKLYSLETTANALNSAPPHVKLERFIKIYFLPVNGGWQKY